MDQRQSPSSPPEPRPASRLPTVLGFCAFLALISGFWFLTYKFADRYPETSLAHYVVAGAIVAVGLLIAILIASLVNKYQS